MKDIRFWAPIIFSIPVTLLCGIIGLGAVGVGHGDALPLLVLFPYSGALMTLAEALGFRELSLIFILALVLQFPLYGLVVAIASLKGKLVWAATVLIALHLAIAGYLFFDLTSDGLFELDATQRRTYPTRTLCAQQLKINPRFKFGHYQALSRFCESSLQS